MRISIIIGCIISLLLLSVALYSQAVAEATIFDFNTPIEWNQFHSAMSLVEIKHFKFKAHDVVAIIGIIALLTCSIATRTYVSTWALLIYSFAYIVIGGFMGLITIAFGWFLYPIDGEFFSDGAANYLGHSFWGYMLIILVIHRLAVRIRLAEQAAPSNR
jgi:hypothetical protein